MSYSQFLISSFLSHYSITYILSMLSVSNLLFPPIQLLCRPSNPFANPSVAIQLPHAHQRNKLRRHSRWIFQHCESAAACWCRPVPHPSFGSECAFTTGRNNTPFLSVTPCSSLCISVFQHPYLQFGLFSRNTPLNM